MKEADYMTDTQSKCANYDAQYIALDEIKNKITDDMTIEEVKELIEAKKKEIRTAREAL